MEIGLFFGSFNPVHNGHLIIANYMVEYAGLNEVWFIVSPQSPLKKSSSLLGAYDRLNLVNLAIKNNVKLKASNIEFSMPKPSYTIDTLTALKEKYPHHEFVLLMGADNLISLPKWKNYESILKYYKIYVYNRAEAGEDQLFNHPNVKLFKAPMLEISATHIRNAIREGKSIRYLVPDEVMEYIDAAHLFR